MDDSIRTHKYTLTEDEMPTTWYNVIPDLPSPPPPPLHPGRMDPVGPEDLLPLFPMDLILQEVSQDRYIDIPGGVLDVYRQWRPSPLFRAHRLEKALDTPARIYYKYEGVSPAGSHKTNTSVPQAYYNKKEGTTKLTTETGAGQWGTALSFACALYDIDCEVWQVGASYDAKPYRRLMIEAFGGRVHRSPSDVTDIGRALAADPKNWSGSLGIAISEAVEDAATRDDTKYALGSVLNHVLLHQTVIGQEAQEQLKEAGAYPDVVVGCVGGGSNFAGIAFPFLADKIAGKDIRVVAVEPAACPTLTRGHYGYDFGDTAQLTPLMPMHTLGHGFIPDTIHSGGLRYHGAAPMVSHLLNLGLIEAVAYPQRECFTEAVRFARTEGIIPAPEPTHAIRQVVAEVERAREEGVSKTILFNLCGHGNFDLAAYDAFFSGTMEDIELPQSELDAAAKSLEGLPAIA